MADCLLLGGEYENNARYGTLTASSTDSDFPLANLVDRISGSQHRFSAAGADDYHSLDQNQSLNGGFEETTFDEDWDDADVGASNTCVEEAVIVNGGSKSCEMQLATAGAGNKAARTQDRIVPAGQYRNVTVALYGDATIYGKARITVVELGWTLKSDGTWDETGAEFFHTQQAAAWSSPASPIEYRVPTVSDGRRINYTLRYEVLTEDPSSTGTAYADDFYDWPSWDFVALIGTRNIGGMITLQLRESTDNFSGSDVLVASPTIYAPTCYHHESSRVTSRYMRVKYVGTNYEPIRIGELIVGQALALSKKFRQPLDVTHDWLQVEADGPWRAVLADEPTRTFEADISWMTTAQWEQWRDEVLLVTQHGRWPVLLVVLDDEGDGACYGMLDAASLKTTRFNQTQRRGSVRVRELPFASWLAD
jgi:hypothetical protein